MVFQKPSCDQWLKEAKESADSGRIGMYLTHNGVVRADAKAKVRHGDENAPAVNGLVFDYDEKAVEAAAADTMKMPGIYYVRTWLNRGTLPVGEDLMLVLIGGDIRPHVMAAMDYLVGRIKSECVTEREY